MICHPTQLNERQEEEKRGTTKTVSNDFRCSSRDLNSFAFTRKKEILSLRKIKKVAFVNSVSWVGECEKVHFFHLSALDDSL